MTRLSLSNILWLMAHSIIIVQSQRGMPGMGGGMPGMGGGMPGMGGGMPGMGGGKPVLGVGMAAMEGEMPGKGGGREIPKNMVVARLQQEREQEFAKMMTHARARARITISTSSQDEIFNEQAYFAISHLASFKWGWLTEIPSDGKGQGCSPLTMKHKEGKLVALMKRGGCFFVDQATNGGTKMSVIYDYKEEKLIPSMSGFRK